jgi:Lon protease-like protein
VVAVIQPKQVATHDADQDDERAYKTGCAGKITHVGITDGEVAVDIRGICRFDVITELPKDIMGVEKVAVSYDKYRVDTENVAEPKCDKRRLMNALEGYFKNLGIAPNWDEIEKTPLDVLVSALTMACHLHPDEKQALLEAIDIKARSDMITKIIEMNTFDKHLTASNSIN